MVNRQGPGNYDIVKWVASTGAMSETSTVGGSSQNDWWSMSYTLPSNYVVKGKCLEIIDITNLAKMYANCDTLVHKYIVCIDSTTCIAAASHDNLPLQRFTVGSNPAAANWRSDNLDGVAIGIVHHLSINYVAACTSSFCKHWSTTVSALGLKFDFPSGYTGMSVMTPQTDRKLSVVFQTSTNLVKILIFDIVTPASPSSYKLELEKQLPKSATITDFTAASPNYLTTSHLAYTRRTSSDAVTLYFYEKQPCHSSCATCNGPLENECLSCAPGQNLGLETPPGPSRCICQNPALNCTKCLMTSSNCIECNANSRFEDTLPTGTKSCHQCWRVGTYAGTSTYCMTCNSGCRTCETTAVTCTSCHPSTTPLYVSSENRTCSTCGGRFFVNGASNNWCFPCDANCGTCLTTAKFCLTCPPTSGHILNETNGCMNCVGTEGYSQIGEICVRCDDNCKYCSLQKTNCTACYAGPKAYLNSYQFNPASKCVACDLVGQFVDGPNCSKCDDNCKGCQFNSTYCTSCHPGFHLDEQNVCVNCTEKIGYSLFGEICVRCDDNCKYCSLQKTNCTACYPEVYLNKYNLSSENKVFCDLCDQNHQYHNDSECMPCDSNCLDCNGTALNCTKCVTDLLIRRDTGENNCKEECDLIPGLYSTTVTAEIKYCDLCDTTCRTCIGSANGCTTCFEAHYLDLGGNIFKSTGDCLACRVACEECRSFDKCDRCSVAWFLDDRGFCVKTCDTHKGQFIKKQNCHDCSSNCFTCEGNKTNCTSCPSGKYLYPNATCGECTEPGWFQSGSTSCAKCDSSCLTCNGGAANNCLSCTPDFELTMAKTCKLIFKNLKVVSKEFASEFTRARFTFEIAIKPKQDSWETHATVSVVNCPIETLVNALDSSTSSGLSLPGSCQITSSGWSVKSISHEAKTLEVLLKVEESLLHQTLVVTFDEEGFVLCKSLPKCVYPKHYLILEDISVIKSKFDGVLESAATAAQVTMISVQGLMLLFAAPQAFILLKVLQTLDYYVFIQCDFPSNFAAFLKLVTVTGLDLLPNMFEGLVDDEGTPMYPRFQDFGLQIHFFSNLGVFFTSFVLMFAFKILAYVIAKVPGKVGTWGSKLKAAFSAPTLYGFWESSHLDCVMAIMIFIAQRDRVNDRSSLLKYIVILFVSLFSLFMVSMYLFMGYTVSRLTKAYFQYGLLEVKDMKDEDWRFLIEDKDMRGNIFQRHFNLIQLLKDILFAVLLYTLYYHPLALIIILALSQGLLVIGLFLYPPYGEKSNNRVIQLTNSLYMLLNSSFCCLIMFGEYMSPDVKRNLMGNLMIVFVVLIIACNVLIAVYRTLFDVIQKCRKRKLKRLGKVGNNKELIILENVKSSADRKASDVLELQLDNSDAKINMDLEDAVIEMKSASGNAGQPDGISHKYKTRNDRRSKNKKGLITVTAPISNRNQTANSLANSGLDHKPNQLRQVSLETNNEATQQLTQVSSANLGLLSEPGSINPGKISRHNLLLNPPKRNRVISKLSGQTPVLFPHKETRKASLQEQCDTQLDEPNVVSPTNKQQVESKTRSATSIFNFKRSSSQRKPAQEQVNSPKLSAVPPRPTRILRKVRKNTKDTTDLQEAPPIQINQL